ncbi:MAG: beta-ureidopropionase [Anaerolineae bacterium]|nr:beta-ureidopropionase [Anaerolineae bacterium]
MFTVGFVQFCPLRYQVEQNIAKLQTLLHGVQADLLVLPELANSGYLYAAPEDLAPYAEKGDGSGPFLSALRMLAAQMGGVIVAGFAEKSEKGLYNSAAAVGGEGVIQGYRKTHLFASEKDLFLPGDSGFQVFTHEGVRVGMMVCFDWFFPESARTLALRGAQVIAHPANLVLPYCQQAMVTRSLENAVFSVTANRYGVEDLPGKTLCFTGGSQLLDTKGNRLLQAPTEGDCVALHEIDPAAADDKVVAGRNHLFRDRRPAMYE